MIKLIVFGIALWINQNTYAGGLGSPPNSAYYYPLSPAPENPRAIRPSEEYRDTEEINPVFLYVMMILRAHGWLMPDDGVKQIRASDWFIQVDDRFAPRTADVAYWKKDANTLGVG